MVLVWLLSLPVLAALFSAVARGRIVWLGNLLLRVAALCLGAFLALECGRGSSVVSFGTFLRADALSAFFVVVITLVDLAAVIYSRSYLKDTTEEGPLSPARSRAYYIFLNVFSATMLAVPLLDNLGAMWVAIELTTLVSAFLVGFYNTKSSVEAAWKYLIICSVGITLALLGTVLFYYAVALKAGEPSLNWSVIAARSGALDPKILGVAFLFIFVGYGTKAGVAPMHTWLPDAHSQALTPVSALLSGVLLKTSLYAIMRFAIIANKALGADFTSGLFVFFGLFSMAVAAVFLLVQKDIKRLLAYSSIEHIGIVVFGLGVGTPLAVFGALFHVLNHALAKSLMFFSAGHMVKQYKSHNMHVMHGLIQALPFTAMLALAGLMALAGMPPFGIFISKLMILTAAFEKGLYGPSALFLFFLAVVFGALIFHLSKVIFGHKPKDMPRGREALSAKFVLAALAVILVVLGIIVPGPLKMLIESASRVFMGV